MSELIVSPSPSDSPVSYSDYGVQISNLAESVTLRHSTTANGVIEIVTKGNTFIAAIDLNDPTIFSLFDGDGALTLTTAAGADVISAGGGDDVISTGNGDDFVDGGEGNNQIQGLDANDFLLSSSGNDTLEGGAGIDLLVSGAGNDSLDGGGGNDILISGAGNDTLVGGEGNDRLQGGPGKDSLIGGEGVDRFRFEKAAIAKGSNSLKKVDQVVDFDPDGEVLEFGRQIFNGKVKPVKGKPNQFGARALMNEDDFKAVDSLTDDLGDAKIIYEKGTGLVYFNSNKGPSPLVQLEANLEITASNFEIFY